MVDGSAIQATVSLAAAWAFTAIIETVVNVLAFQSISRLPVRMAPDTQILCALDGGLNPDDDLKPSDMELVVEMPSDILS